MMLEVVFLGQVVLAAVLYLVEALFTHHPACFGQRRQAYVVSSELAIIRAREEVVAQQDAGLVVPPAR